MTKITYANGEGSYNTPNTNTYLVMPPAPPPPVAPKTGAIDWSMPSLKKDNSPAVLNSQQNLNKFPKATAFSDSIAQSKASSCVNADDFAGRPGKSISEEASRLKQGQETQTQQYVVNTIDAVNKSQREVQVSEKASLFFEQVRNFIDNEAERFRDGQEIVIGEAINDEFKALAAMSPEDLAAHLGHGAGNALLSHVSPDSSTTESKTERVSNALAERDKLLKEVYGPSYMPESTLATIGVAAIGSAANHLLQDTLDAANVLSNVHLNNNVIIHSMNDSERADAWNRNKEIYDNVNNAVDNVCKNPETIPAHYSHRFQDATDKFSSTLEAGDLIGAGDALGQELYDTYVITSTVTGATGLAAKAVKRAIKTAKNVIAANNLKPPMVFQYEAAQLNLQNPVVPNPIAVNLTAEYVHGSAANTMQTGFTKAVSREAGMCLDKHVLANEGSGHVSTAKSPNMASSEEFVVTEVPEATAVNMTAECAQGNSSVSGVSSSTSNVRVTQTNLAQPNLDTTKNLASAVEKSDNSALIASSNEFVSLYRAVKPDEVIQINTTGKLENIRGIERKYFSTTYDGAKQYASMAEKGFGDQPYKIVETKISKIIFESLPSDLKEIVDNGIQAVLIPTESLDVLSSPQFLDHIFRPTFRSE